MSKEITPEKALDIVKYLGIEANDVDEFKTKFSADYIKRSLVKDDEELAGQIFGKKAGSLEKVIGRAAKTLGFEVNDDFKKMSLDEKIEAIADVTSNNFTKKLKDLESQVKTGDHTEVLKDWEKKYSKLEQKYNDRENLFNGLKTEYETFKSEASNKFKKRTVDLAYNDAMSKLKFEPTVSEITKTGFKAILNEKYEIDLDETENPFIKDKKTGARIKSEKKAGEWADIADIFEKEAIEAKLLNLKPENGSGQNNGFHTFFKGNENGNGGNNGGGGNNHAAKPVFTTPLPTK